MEEKIQGFIDTMQSYILDDLGVPDWIYLLFLFALLGFSIYKFNYHLNNVFEEIKKGFKQQ